MLFQLGNNMEEVPEEDQKREEDEGPVTIQIKHLNLDDEETEKKVPVFAQINVGNFSNSSRNTKP